jgi:hypothetical protein
MEQDSGSAPFFYILFLLPQHSHIPTSPGCWLKSNRCHFIMLVSNLCLKQFDSHGKMPINK